MVVILHQGSIDKACLLKVRASNDITPYMYIVVKSPPGAYILATSIYNSYLPVKELTIVIKNICEVCL